MLAAFWAGEDGEHPAVISDAGNRSRAEANANANRLVRALRARGVKAGDGIALMCSNRPEFVETVAAAQRAGLRLTTVNWHLTGDEAGYIVDDCEATAFVADARVRGASPARPPTSRRGCACGSRSAARSTASSDWDDVLAPEPGADIDDPSSAARCSTRRARPADRRVCDRAARSAQRARRRALTQYRGRRHVHLCTGPLYHAAPLSFSLTAPLAMRRAGRDDGRLVGRARRSRSSRSTRVTHTHMVPTMFHRLLSLPDDVKRALRHLVAASSSSTAPRRARST